MAQYLAQSLRRDGMINQMRSFQVGNGDTGFDDTVMNI